MPVVAPLVEAGAGAEAGTAGAEVGEAGAAGEGAGGGAKPGGLGGNPLHKLGGMKPIAPKVPEIPIPGFSEGHVGGLASYLNPAQFH